eukprot:8101167-Pyramimonas_sp.AAC.1
MLTALSNATAATKCTFTSCGYGCCLVRLAVGVNLPAYLVVIMGTQRWNGGKYEEDSQACLLYTSDAADDTPCVDL